MKIIRAEHMGMCFGVRDAVALAKAHSQIEPITIFGDLVHNQSVVRDLRSRGVSIETELEKVGTQMVIITAHGTSEKTRGEILSRGFNVLEATCPLVNYAHRSLKRLVDRGFYPVIIGKREHVEVRGMTDDLKSFSVLLGKDDVVSLPSQSKYGIVAQTTQPIERVRGIVEEIRMTFPQAEVEFTDTVCQPTKQRQKAASDLAQQCTIVIVVGGNHSNNTQELVQTCRKHCGRVYHIVTAVDLKTDWFRKGDYVGITAGTSTPDYEIDAVENKLMKLWDAQPGKQ